MNIHGVYTKTTNTDGGIALSSMLFGASPWKRKKTKQIVKREKKAKTDMRQLELSRVRPIT